MTINDRINKIGEYFKSLNIVDEETVVLVKFPPKWKVFNNDELLETFGVGTGTDKNIDGIFFVGNTNNGIERIFDAIDEVISQNKTFEEKASLLEEKANELSSLFLTEPLEKLKTLEFVFKNKKAVKRQQEPSKNIEIHETPIEDVKVNINKEKEKVSKKTAKNGKKGENESDMMSFMKELTEGGLK